MADQLPAIAGEYQVFKTDPHDLADLLDDLKGTSVQELDRVKIPSGGGLFFEVPGIDGPTPQAALRGIILGQRTGRLYWREAIGEGKGTTPPDCSGDGEFGWGQRWDGDKEEAHQCDLCPFSRFGSDEGGRGQSCKQVLLVFLLQPGSLIPLVLSLPPTSIKAAKQYILRLAGKALKGYAVETEWKLEKAQNADGVAYARAVPKALRTLAPAEVAQLGSLAAQLKKVFSATKVKAADYAEEGPKTSAAPPMA